MTARNRPFGVLGHNGLNFARSQSDPNSMLSKVLNFINLNPGVSRDQICAGALGRPRTKSSWASTFWSCLHLSGLVVKNGRGMTATYSLPKGITYPKDGT